MTDFDALLCTLGNNEVAFIAVGGAAAIAHGSGRLTQNLDIVYERSPSNLDRLVAAGEACGQAPERPGSGG
jgi:hypothetical protein